MSKRYLTLGADGMLHIIQLLQDDPTGKWLAKTLYRDSRTVGPEPIPFDFSIHTLEAIADGVTGHRPLSVLAEIEDTDLPVDRTFRDAWEWSA